MTRKTFAIAIIALLAALNIARFFGGENDTASQDRVVATSPNRARLMPFYFDLNAPVSAPQTKRDIFVYGQTKAPQIAPPPEQPKEEPPQAPDPKEVALDAARIDLLNIRVTGIISSQNGLRAMVNAPFYTGAAGVGDSLGKGIVIDALNSERIRLLHPELELRRDISLSD